MFNAHYELIATHERAEKPGQRQTHPDHLPPEKLPGLERNRESCLAQACQVGPATQAVVEQHAGRSGAGPHAPGRASGAPAGKVWPGATGGGLPTRAGFEDASYKTVKGILKQGTDQQELPIPVEIPPATTFARSPAELVGDTGGGAVMELKHQLANQLRQLRLSGVLETLEARHRQAIDGQWSYLEFLSRLLEDEVERRAQKQLTLRLRRGALNTTKTLEGFDFQFNPNLNRQQVLQPGHL